MPEKQGTSIGEVIRRKGSGKCARCGKETRFLYCSDKCEKEALKAQKPFMVGCGLLILAGFIALMVFIVVQCVGPDSHSTTIRRGISIGPWPLTASTAELHCRNISRGGYRLTAVWIEVGDNKYALNGTALARLDELGLRDIRTSVVWRGDGMGGKVSIMPLIEQGLTLCE